MAKPAAVAMNVFVVIWNSLRFIGRNLRASSAARAMLATSVPEPVNVFLSLYFFLAFTWLPASPY